MQELNSPPLDELHSQLSILNSHFHSKDDHYADNIVNYQFPPKDNHHVDNIVNYQLSIVNSPLHFSRAETPGKTFPSKNSSIAPPPVET